MEVPFVSVIIPVFNNQEGAAALLRALERQTYPTERFECLIVDNGSAPPLEFAGDSAIDCRILYEDQAGSYAARNRGVSAARGTIIACTDSDCLPADDWLERGVEGLSGFDGPGMIGGRIRIECRDDTAPTAFELHNVINGFPQEDYLAHHHFAATANMICHRELFDRVGLFDSSLFSGADNLWGRCVYAAGLRQSYLQDVVVTHPALADHRQFWKKYRRISGGLFQIHRREGWSMPRVLAHVTVGCTRRWLKACRDARCRTWRDTLRLTYTNSVQCAMLIYECIRLWCGGTPRRG